MTNMCTTEPPDIYGEKLDTLDSEYHREFPEMGMTPHDYLLGMWNKDSIDTLHTEFKSAYQKDIVTINQLTQLEYELFQDDISQHIMNNKHIRFISCYILRGSDSTKKHVKYRNANSTQPEYSIDYTAHLTDYTIDWVLCSSKEASINAYKLFISPRKKSIIEKVYNRFSSEAYFKRYRNDNE